MTYYRGDVVPANLAHSDDGDGIMADDKDELEEDELDGDQLEIDAPEDEDEM